MRIAIDGRTIKAKPSGLGIWNIRLIEELLAQTEHELYTVTSKNCTFAFPKHPRLHTLPVSHPYQFVSFRRMMTEQFELLALLRKISPDIYHATDSTGIPFFLPKRIKTVLTVHDLIPLTPYREMMSDLQYHLLYRPSLLASVRKANALVAISENTKEDLVAYGICKPDKVRVIHDGIDQKTTPDNGQTLSTNWNAVSHEHSLAENKYILYIGGFGSRRNVPTVLRLFRRLLDTGLVASDTKLVLSGRINNAKNEALMNLETLKKIIVGLRLQQATVLLDYLPNDIKTALIRKSLFVISLSLYEGFGLAPLEALLEKKETYLTKVGIMKSFRSKNSFVIEDPLSLDEMSVKIGSNLNGKNRGKSREFKDLLDFVGQFSWQKMAHAYNSIYLDLAG